MTYLCAIQRSGSVAFSNQSHQWFFFVLSNSHPNSCLASLNCSQIGLLGFPWALHTFCQLFSMFFQRLVSSLVHHLFACGPSMTLRITLSIVSCKAAVSLSHSLLSFSCDLINFGTPQVLIFPFSISLNSFQSTSLKLLISFLGVSSTLMSRLVTMGKWLC